MAFRIQDCLDDLSFVSAALHVELVQQLALAAHAGVALQHEVDGQHASDLDFVDTVDHREQGVIPVLIQILDHARQHLQQLFQFPFLERLDYELAVLAEEKEVAALASIVVFLAVVRLEDLVPVVLGVHAFHYFVVVYVVDRSNQLECLLAVDFDRVVDLDLVEQRLLLCKGASLLLSGLSSLLGLLSHQGLNCLLLFKCLFLRVHLVR